ncbi:serine hydrolase [uncultured Thermosynechococcus sp.]|uniref:serine hydrolase n=2 Tax=uncultured Thermosynechococcus sp. TaxID=436945 RepID=UPI0026311412|nr:serine hydrolase [uncultured Thermosynechococcus sp.]
MVAQSRSMVRSSGLSSLPHPATPPTSSTTPPRPNLFLMTLRFGVSVVALAATVGTLLSVLQPQALSPQTTAGQAIAPETPTPNLPPERPLTTLQRQIQQLVTRQPNLTAGLYFFNLDSGASLNVSGDQVFPAASTIKFPILVAFFKAVDEGRVTLHERLTMRPDLIAPEAGTLQYQKPNSQYPVLEVAELMVTISDNTATNMIIDRLGGAAVLNQQFREWGLENTVIHNPLPDMQGTNTTSPRDLATLMLKIAQGEIVSPRSRDRLLDMMRRTVTKTLLPAGLGKGATIAHKTGDIGIVVGDAGMVDMPNGQRYVAAMMVKRPYNDPRGSELIRQVSRMVYQAFEKLPPTHP